MKLKSYQLFLESDQDIHKICKEYGIQNYTINEYGSIDVDGNVDLSNKNLTRIPLKFRNVSGIFSCRFNQLTSLEGCPKSVGGDFYCSNNQLTSLEGCPQSVGGDFYCFNNQLTSLEGCPQSVGGYFDCQNNQLKDFRGFPDFWEGHINFQDNPVQSILDQFPEELWCKAIYWINEYDVIDEEDNVIEERLDEVQYQLGLINI